MKEIEDGINVQKQIHIYIYIYAHTFMREFHIKFVYLSQILSVL
jgi:hypothetical protein